jgi:hypothetical protein
LIARCIRGQFVSRDSFYGLILRLKTNKLHSAIERITEEGNMKEFDYRLPKGYAVFLNGFEEWVVIDENDKVAKVDKDSNVRASRNFEGAIQHYLNKRVSNGMVE